MNAFQKLSAMTGGTCSFSTLRGPGAAKDRAVLMGMLEGRKVPQSKAGVNALRTAFHWHAGVIGRVNFSGKCIAEADRLFEVFARKAAQS